MTETRLSVRFAETDLMGIVHHSNYPVWFEMGRTDYFKTAGLSVGEIVKAGVQLPLTHLECRFFYPALYDDVLIVRTRLSKLTCARMEFTYEVVKEDGGVLLATGASGHAWTDSGLKPINVIKRFPEIFGGLKALQSEEG